ncbi:MAG: type I-C CRISPR-associated protein Cas8c/Csd1 [Nitrospirae bacterium]|nr:type I-C CRISPR-associated protein Cas8c/Csd1 [Nitrospirota bacterium]
MLHRLVEYASKEGLDPEPGFTTHELRWEAQIDSDGKLINVLPLGDESGGENTPKCPLMHNMTAGGRAHFLVETVQTVVLLFKKNEKAKKMSGTKIRHEFFSSMIHNAAKDVPVLKPLSSFYKSQEQVSKLHDKLLKEKAKPAERLKWRVAGVDVITQPDVQSWWRLWYKEDLNKGVKDTKSKKKKSTHLPEDDKVLAGEMLCFISGERVAPLSTHDKITNLPGGLSFGDVIIGFDKDAFCSFGLKQGYNAAIGGKYASAYVNALNHLIKNYLHKLANTLVIHWFKESVKQEDDPLSFLNEPLPATEAAAQGSARKILEAIRDGHKPNFPAGNRYYVMTISSATSRVMVRDWMEGSFKELVDNIITWFDNLEIVNINGKKTAQDSKLEGVVTSLLKPRKPNQAYKDWTKPIGHERIDLLHSAIQLPRLIPFHIIARIVTLLPAFFISEELNHLLFGKQQDIENSGLYLSILYARMGLIKAYFIRKGGNHAMSVYLNKEHPEPAYQCGRLLAVLASLQHAALGDVGAGVVQRYYVAASQAPGLTFGRLIANSKNHLNKLDGDDAFEYEGQISEIMCRIQDRMPATLNLENQSLFALGYYQQIAANRAG